MLLEEAPRSISPVEVTEPHFSVREEFRGASYAKRYELFCQKLVRERLYDAACFLFVWPILRDSSSTDLPQLRMLPDTWGRGRSR